MESGHMVSYAQNNILQFVDDTRDVPDQTCFGTKTDPATESFAKPIINFWHAENVNLKKSPKRIFIFSLDDL